MNERLDAPGATSHGTDHEERKNDSRERRLPYVTAVIRKEADDWLAKCRRDLVAPAANEPSDVADNL